MRMNDCEKCPPKPARLLALALCIIPLLFLMGCASTADSANSAAAPPLSPGSVVATQNPLVANYTISPNQTASVYVVFGTTTQYGMQTSAKLTPDGGGPVTIFVAGMKANTTYHMEAVVTYAHSDVVQFDTDHTFKTGTPPADVLPQATVTIPPGMSPSPGVEFACLSGGTSTQAQLVAFDPSGNVIWYYHFDPSLGIVMPAKPLPNGDLLLLLGGAFSGGTNLGVVREIDLAGDTIHQFTVADINRRLKMWGYNLQLSTLDHDFASLPNGHLLLLGTNQEAFADLPGYPGTTTVNGNAIVDLNAEGDPAWVWNAFDHLDVNRHPIEFPDWTHANTLVYSPIDGNLLLSLRHQNWVIKINYANGLGNGDIIWRLGYQGDFTLDQGASDWFFAQHDATILSQSNPSNFLLGVFDNGNDRLFDGGTPLCGTNGGPCYSRSAIFKVDQSNMTASLVWSSGPIPFSLWGGVTQLLPDSDVFIDETTPADNPKGARVWESTQQSNPQTVWQMNINGQNSYRTIHLPSLYPGVQW